MVTSSVPLPVVVLGHFTDPRVTAAYDGAQYFVVDQLVWTAAGGTIAQSDAVRLTAVATEKPEAVLERVQAELGRATATWVSVLTPADLQIQDPEAVARAPELLDARAVWVVRRLVDRPYDDLTRHIVGTAFTADGGSRIFSRAASSVELATSIDLRPGGSDTRPVEVFDHPDIVIAARAVTPADRLDWRRIGPVEGVRFEIAAGPSDRALAIRWSGRACQTEWTIQVFRDDSGLVIYADPRDVECSGDPILRAIVLTLDGPIDLDTVKTNDNTSGG